MCCRTTTVSETQGYDPSVSGCWTMGTPLAWKVPTIEYSLQASASRQVTLADATRIIDAAFAKWTSAACSQTDVHKHPGIGAQDIGPVDSGFTDCGIVKCGDTVHDTEHVIVFDDAMWPHNDPNNTLALTTVTFGVDSGQIYDADMEINSFQHQLSLSSPAPPGSFSLDAIVTHEAGHFLGFAHSTDRNAVMYVRYNEGSTQLTADDVGCVCEVYPPASPASATAGCACGIAGGASADASLLLVGALVAAAVVRRVATS